MIEIKNIIKKYIKIFGLLLVFVIIMCTLFILYTNKQIKLFLIVISLFLILLYNYPYKKLNQNKYSILSTILYIGFAGTIAESLTLFLSSDNLKYTKYNTLKNINIPLWLPFFYMIVTLGGINTYLFFKDLIPIIFKNKYNLIK